MWRWRWRRWILTFQATSEAVSTVGFDVAGRLKRGPLAGASAVSHSLFSGGKTRNSRFPWQKCIPSHDNLPCFSPLHYATHSLARPGNRLRHSPPACSVHLLGRYSGLPLCVHLRRRRWAGCEDSSAPCGFRTGSSLYALSFCGSAQALSPSIPGFGAFLSGGTAERCGKDGLRLSLSKFDLKEGNGWHRATGHTVPLAGPFTDAGQDRALLCCSINSPNAKGPSGREAYAAPRQLAAIPQMTELWRLGRRVGSSI
jgi:hypothetical protein